MTIAGINTRLQVGTTPGNPILIQQFNAAEGDLDRLANDVIDMNKMVTSINGNSNLASYLAEATRATFGLSGAVDEDHRQLAILQDEVDQTLVLIDRLLGELGQDIRRQTEYVASERSNLNLLASGIRNGEIYGNSFTNQPMISRRQRVDDGRRRRSRRRLRRWPRADRWSSSASTGPRSPTRRRSTTPSARSSTAAPAPPSTWSR